MKKIILVLIVFMPLIVLGQVKFRLTTFKEAMQIAATENKGILVDVVSGKIDKKNINQIFADKELAELINRNFITIRVDMMKPDNEYFSPYLGNNSYPCVLFFTNRGENIGFCHWDEIVAGRQNLNVIAEAAIDNAAEKRMNTRKIEFRPLTYAEALQAAKKENKPVFIDCSMEHCGPCRKMETDVFTINQVADCYNKNFICIWTQRETDEDKLAEKFDVHGFPSFIFVDGDGNVLGREEGFLPVDKFLALAKKIIEGDQSEVKSVPMMGSSAAEPISGSGSVAAATSSNSETGAASVSGSGSTSSAASGTAATMVLQDELQADASKIPFEKLTLAQAMKKAAKEKKMIYVDLSATWCGPCQQLKKTTFRDDMVVDFMIKNYINIAFECDKDGEMSLEYRNKFKSTAFPTHLIISETGELIHKFVGFHRPAEFIAEMRKGVGTDKGLGYYNRKYAEGERSPEFMNQYISMLAAANEGATASGLACEYLNTLSLDELTERKNFILVYEFARDIDSELAQKVVTNYKKFEKALGKEELNNYMYLLWTVKADSYVTEVDGKKTYDKQGFEACCKKMKASGFEAAESIALGSSARNAILMDDWDSFMDTTLGYMHKNKGKANPMITCNWGMDVQRACKDKEIRRKFADELEKNFELIKKSGSEAAVIWSESVKLIAEDLRK